jgi:DNA-directed RNA polymerase subunit RPC12/RpoP
MFHTHPHNYHGSKKYYCIDCGASISSVSLRCKSCSRRGLLSWSLGISRPKGINSHSWKGGKPKCVDCGVQLSSYNKKHIRCRSCSNSYKYKDKRNCPMFGKTSSWHLYKYKGHWMKSSWEVIMALWLDTLNIVWDYEKYTFDLGQTTYTPDFYLPVNKEFMEIKGWWRDKSKEKFDLFKKLYPTVDIKLVVKKDIDKIKMSLSPESKSILEKSFVKSNLYKKHNGGTK